MKSSIFAVSLSLVLAAAGAARGAEQRVELATRPGVTETFYVTRAAPGPAAAALLLFTGGDGKLRSYGPANPERGNFLVRSRDLFVAQGFTVAVIDAPSDQSSGMGGFRLSADHAHDIAAVVGWLRQDSPAPVWLVGTSRGTISAALGAATAGDLVAGLVLTSSVTREAKRQPGTVLDAGLDRIRVPTLVTYHKADICQVTPPADASYLMSRLANAPRKELLLFEGGAPARSEPCEALAPHGYFGIERQATTAIGDWIKRAAR